MSKKSFAEIVQEMSVNNKPNSVISGKIIGKMKKDNIEYFLVDAWLKSEGIVAISEFGENIPEIGSKINLMIVGESGGKLILSYQKMKKNEMIKKIKDAYEAEEAVEATIHSVLGNGYKVTILDDITAFWQNEDKDLKVGDKYKVYIIRPTFNNVHVSSNKVKKISVGDVVDCVIKSIYDFVIFVDLPGFGFKESLIYCNDLGSERHNLTEGNIKVGSMLKAKVVKIEPNRVFLSVKALDMDFWNDVDKKYKSGDIVDGTVNAIKDSGIIVGFDGVLEGFAHISEIFWNTHHVNLSSKFKEGQKVKCVILDIEPERKRIKLGMKQLEEDPFENFIKKYKSGQDVESIVLNKPTDYHTFLFVRLVLDGLDGVEIDGMLHESEMDWNINKSRDMFNSLEVGKKILVRIANINHKSRRVSVSVKIMNPDMFESSLGKVTVGKVYSCEIKNIDYMGLWVKLLKDGSNEAIADCDGFIGKNELSRDKSITWKKFSIGMVIEAKLLKINHDSRCLMLSIKAMENDLHKNAIKNYGNDESTKQSFADILQF